MTDETPLKVIVNCETGETIHEPLTADEIAALAAAAEQAAADAKAQADAAAALAALKASAKAKLVAGQPLTSEEADTLVI